HPLAGGAKHVVGASCVPIIPVFILAILITRDEPFTSHPVPRKPGAIPVARGSTGTANPEIAKRARRHIMTFRIHDADFIPGNSLPRTAGLHAAWRGRDIDVQHFSGTDAIEDLDTESVLPPPKNLCRERLRRGHCETNAR